MNSFFRADTSVLGCGMLSNATAPKASRRPPSLFERSCLCADARPSQITPGGLAVDFGGSLLGDISQYGDRGNHLRPEFRSTATSMPGAATLSTPKALSDVCWGDAERSYCIMGRLLRNTGPFSRQQRCDSMSSLSDGKALHSICHSGARLASKLDSSRSSDHRFTERRPEAPHCQQSLL